jgi:sulfur carrier protein
MKPADPASGCLELLVNGQRRQWPQAMTVLELLRSLELDKPAIAVELNQQLVPRAEYPATALRSGDHVEIVSLAGGG